MDGLIVLTYTLDGRVYSLNYTTLEDAKRAAIILVTAEPLIEGSKAVNPKTGSSLQVEQGPNIRRILGLELELLDSSSRTTTMTDDEKTALAQKIYETYGIAMDHVFLDNDKRSGGIRRIRVLSVVSKPGKACCANCDANGRNLGKTLWISFERLNNKRLYTWIDHIDPSQPQ